MEAAHPRRVEAQAIAHVRELVPATSRRFQSPHQTIPRPQLLCNGRYAVMMTAAGSGYSLWGDLAVTRWREDPTCDCWGSYVFLRDADRGTVWSAGYQPTGVEPDSYGATLLEDRVEIVRRDGTITTKLEVIVSPEDDAEARRVTISNVGRRPREIAVTSYAEVVLASPAADTAHPAFSKLFVQTEFVGEIGALLATRRRRSPDEPRVWAAHLAVVEGELVGRAAVRDRPRTLHGAREEHSRAHLGHRRSTALRQVRRRARPDLQSPSPHQAGTGGHCARHLLDPRGGLAQGRARPGRQASRPCRVRARQHPGLDAGAGPAVSPRHRLGRGEPVPTPRRPCPICEPGPPSFIRCSRPQ